MSDAELRRWCIQHAIGSAIVGSSAAEIVAAAEMIYAFVSRATVH